MIKTCEKFCYIFKFVSLLFAFSICAWVNALAEDVELSSLKTPMSPGFVLLGIEPTSVESPSTPTAFALSLISNARAVDFLPKNYAIEVAPYWLGSHPTLTFEEYYNANLIQTILQTTSISLVTSEFTSSEDSSLTGTRLGVGFRTHIISGKASKRLSSLVGQLKKIQEEILKIDDEGKEKRLMEEAQEIALKIQKEDKRRIGLITELAGAFVIDFPEDNFDNGEITRVGAWLTGAYRWDNPFIDALFVIRYITDLNEGSEDLFDAGFRLLFQSNRFALSTEFIERFKKSSNGKKDNYYRIVGTFEYHLVDNLYLTTSFGKNYDMGHEGKNDLVAFLGMNFGFGEKPTLNF